MKDRQRDRGPRILLACGGGVGALVCATPLIRALREQLPEAHLAALVSRDNAAVLAGNPDLDAVSCYAEAKHRRRGESLMRVCLDRLRMIGGLRNERFDWLLLPGAARGAAPGIARWIGAARVLVRDRQDAAGGEHEVEQCCHLLVRMGLRYQRPALRLVADPAEVALTVDRMQKAWGGQPPTVIGLHVSAREPSGRWPAERFAELARRLYSARRARIVLLWAPGRAGDARRPGDDDRARAIYRAVPDVPMLRLRTARLEELIAALAACDSVICSNGGAMHLAAALGKPVVCLFGDSSAERWHPWGTRHGLLQPASRDVREVSIDEVLAAYERVTEPTVVSPLSVPPQLTVPPRSGKMAGER